MQLTVYDTILRDGGQDPRFSISKDKIDEKLKAVKALDGFGVDYIELAWPTTNTDIQLFKRALELDLTSKVVAFCSTRKLNDNPVEEDDLLNRVLETGVDYVTLFGKTWKDQVEKQLKATPEENLEAIAESVQYMRKNNKTVFYDAEHFFDGFKDDKEYALKCLETAINAGASAVVLCDTTGGCMPDEIMDITREVKKYLDEKHKDVELGIHCHNDSECAVANTNLAIKQGATHVQGTIGGVGERTGNANLCSVLPNAVLKQGFSLNDRIDLKQLTKFNKEMHEILGIEPSQNQPYVSKAAFAHNGGVHVDAVLKGASYNHITPEFVGNIARVCLTNNSGRGSVIDVVEGFGYKTQGKSDARVASMLDEVHEMTNKGYNISLLRAEHYLLTLKHFGNYDDIFTVDRFRIISEDIYSNCKIWGKVNEQDVKTSEDVEGGPVDAAYKAIKDSIKDPILDNVHLVHYGVEIPKAGSHEEASSVNVYITFRNGNEEWTTVGNNPNILEASIEAITKGFRYYILKNRETEKKYQQIA